jgi:hypothetical protein
MRPRIKLTFGIIGIFVNEVRGIENNIRKYEEWAKFVSNNGSRTVGG